MAHNEDVVKWLGGITTFFLAFMILEVLWIMDLLHKRKSCWNILGAMQELNAQVTLNDWERTITAGNPSLLTKKQTLDLLSTRSYNTLQPPRVGEEGREMKLDNYRKQTRMKQRMMRIDGGIQGLENEQKRRRIKLEDAEDLSLTL